MDNIVIRFTIIGLALFGVYKIFPQISGPIDYYIKNPKFQSSVVTPAVTAANNILPDKLQLPTPTVMGIETEYTGEAPLKAITDQITGQAASVAADLLQKSSKAVSDQFCTVLIEKIRTECGK